MSIADFSEAYEGHRNRIEADEYESTTSKDLEAYNAMREGIDTANYVAEERLKVEFPKAFEYYKKYESENDEEAFDDLLSFKKKNKDSVQLIDNLFLKEYFRDLNDKIRIYIDSIHQAEIYGKKHGGEIDEDVKANLSELETRRSQAHDALIGQLKILARNMNKAGIDNSWESVVGLANGQAYRKEIQRWAENVSDHLVSVSESTT